MFQLRLLQVLKQFFLPATLDEGALMPIEVPTSSPSPTPPGLTVAAKFDNGKPRMALIPVRAKKEVAKCFTAGAVKYDVGNWKEGDGFDYDRPLSAAERHIDDFLLGKRIDDGPGGAGTHILANAICELMFVLEFELSEHGKDNRTKLQYLPNGVEPFPKGYLDDQE